ncbi:MAG: hypothetical protein IKX57_06330 [Oscillospiraceae bacterium]|nr:hypothetical protein [Oscillospiraceae bacterium]
MTFRIRHEKISTVLILIAVFSLFCTLSFVFVVLEMTLGLICSVILMLVTIVLFILEQTVRTVVTVEDDAVTVRQICCKKRIAVHEISDIRTERYIRMRKRFFKEQRMRMVITLTNGKNIVLTDSAMADFGGVLLRESTALPDEEVPLYRAYQAIEAMRY